MHKPYAATEASLGQFRVKDLWILCISGHIEARSSEVGIDAVASHLLQHVFQGVKQNIVVGIFIILSYCCEPLQSRSAHCSWHWHVENLKS